MIWSINVSSILVRYPYRACSSLLFLLDRVLLAVFLFIVALLTKREIVIAKEVLEKVHAASQRDIGCEIKY